MGCDVSASGTPGDESTPDGVQVIWFGKDTPFVGVVTLATLGLSQRHLNQPSGKGIHQELVMHLPMFGEPPNAAGILFDVAQEVIERGQGLLRGEVFGPRGQLFEDSELTALYVAAPVYLPDEFASCQTPERKVMFAWLVPIAGAEAAYVSRNGWQTFEKALLAENPDLCDLDRKPIAAALG